MKKYGDSAGHHQEQEGPAVAENMLERLGYEGDIIKRVCYLVGHHHTYQGIDKLDCRILVEADLPGEDLAMNSSSKKCDAQRLWTEYLLQKVEKIS